MTLSEEENDANMKLSQLKNIMNKNYYNTTRYIEEILKTGYEINSVIASTPHLESKQPRLIGCTALHLAFQENCTEGFKTLLKAGADYTIKNRDGLTVLHQILEDFYKNESRLRLDSKFATMTMSAHSNNLVNLCTSYGLSHFHAACLCNNADLVKSFLESGVSVDDAVKIDSPCFPGYTPLHFAVRSYGFETVQVLLEKGADQNLENAEKRTPLIMLTEQKIKLMSSLGTSTMVSQTQLDDALDKHEKITHLLYNNNNYVNFSTFHLACTMKESSFLENILESRVDVNRAIDQDSPLWPGFTGLHFAALCNSENVILLLRKGANIETRNSAGVTAFDMCLNSCEPKSISKILSTVEIWKDIVLSDNETALVELVKVMSNSEQFETFLKNSPGKISAIIPANTVLWPGFTVLHVAVQLFVVDIAIVNTCLKAGADVKAQSANGSSALHLAFRKEKTSLVDILLHDYSEQLSNLTDDENLSVLHIACSSLDNYEFATKLVRFGTDVNVAYRGKPIGAFLRRGFTPLHVAVVSGNSMLTRLLLEYDADPYAADSDGFTPMHWVFAAPDPDIVGAPFFVSTYPVRESIVSGLSHLHVASYIVNGRFLDHYEYTQTAEFVKTLLAMPNASVDVAVIYEGNSSPSFLCQLAGATPFCLAMRQRNWLVARLLAGSGCDVFVRQPNGIPTLYDALLNDFGWLDGQEVAAIWKNNERAQRRAQKDIGVTKLHLACYMADVREVQRLLKSGENPNAQIHLDSPLWPGYTALHICVIHQMDPYMIEYLSNNRDVVLDYTLRTADGDTAVHLAYKHEKEQWLGKLFDRYSNYNDNFVNDAGLAYLHIACSIRNINIVVTLVGGGVDVNLQIDPFSDDDSTAGQTPLHLALDPKRADNSCNNMNSISMMIIDELLENGAKVNARDAVGKTPLHRAVEYGKAEFDLLKKVVEAAADVKAIDVFGTNPWDLLLTMGEFSAEKLELFIEKGCRLNGFNSVDNHGYASLVFYHHGGQSEEKRLLFEAMLNHPQSIDTDEKGCTVVHSFVAMPVTKLSCNEYAKLVEQLLILSNTDCDIDDQDNEGRAALHVAAYHGNHSAIEGLLIAGADINVADNNGDLTFDYLSDEDSDLGSTVIARHIKKLEILRLTASPKNRDFAARVFERLHLDEASLEESVRAESELAKSVEISVGSYSLSLRNFLTETYSDTTIHALTGYRMGTLIKRFFRDFKDNRFAELRSIFKLQYRKAVARSRLIEGASGALDRMSRCTVQCARLVTRFCTNDEMGYLIEARKSIDD